MQVIHVGCIGGMATACLTIIPNNPLPIRQALTCIKTYSAGHRETRSCYRAHRLWSV